MSRTETILRRILERTKKPGSIRCFLIALIFPEFHDIMGDLADLCEEHKL